jgi:DNA polymerase II small subunit/DNA polymerase delta subunit B
MVIVSTIKRKGNGHCLIKTKQRIDSVSNAVTKEKEIRAEATGELLHHGGEKRTE